MSDVVGNAKAHSARRQSILDRGVGLADLDEYNVLTLQLAQMVPDLVAELERLQSAAKTLGKIIDDSLTDILKATDSHDIIGEDGDGDWMLVFERLMELRPARDAALAEVDRLQSGGPWMEHVERQRAMKRERDGECICNTGPDTDGPAEDCPWHGREYRYWVNGVTAKAAEADQLREGLDRIENFARIQALSDRVRSGPNYTSSRGEERYWLDLLAIVERVQGGAS